VNKRSPHLLPGAATSASDTSPAPIRLGGFVIHGGEIETLGVCLDHLASVCDDVVIVISGDDDPVQRIARGRSARVVEHAWEGFGSARAAAVEALRGCDYLLSLDSDERFGMEAVDALRAWRASRPTAPYYALPVRDWARLPRRQFLFRVEHHVRLVRWDAAQWTRNMIVHEALPSGVAVRLGAPIDHEFANSIDARAAKCETYALLWALRYADSARRPKPVWLQRVFHVIRDCIVKGAIFRGGLDATRLAWAVSGYHARKYELLRQVRAGAFAELAALVRAGDYGGLFRRLQRAHDERTAG
jgi:(heptosyl)LPS beta-1,4-glucosyltransferase